MLDKHSNRCYNKSMNSFECAKGDKIKLMLEKLWNEYFAEECSAVDTPEEKTLIKKAADMHKAVNEMLTAEEREAVDKCIESIYELQSLFEKKAFLKGCELATSFIIEAGYFKREED